MRLSIFLLLSIGILSFSSCDIDQCTQRVTYVRATAIYGDLNDYRVNDIISPVRAIEHPGKIYVSSELILIGEKSQGIHVIDNTVTENPVNVSFLDIPNNYEFYVDNEFIYANSNYDLVKIDISDVTNIHITDRLESAFRTDHFNASGDALIGFDRQTITEEGSCDTHFQDGEVYFFDFNGVLLDEAAIPTSFVSNGTSVGTANRMAVVDDELFVINKSEVNVFDINSNLIEFDDQFESPVSVGWNLETIYAQGNLLFIGSQNGMEIFEVNNNSVQHSGAFVHADACDPVLPTPNNIAYVTLRSGDECPGDINSLNVIDFNNVTFPNLIQEIPMSSPYGMSLIDDKLYVGEGENGLRIFDAGNNRELSEIELINISAYDIISHPSISSLILLASKDGLTQYQINHDTKLEVVSTITF